MRILYLNHTSLISGAEVSLLGLLRHLDRFRFQPVAALPEPGPLSDALGQLDIPVHYLPLRRLKRRQPPSARLADMASLGFCLPRLMGLIRAHRIDILHSNSTIAQIYGAPAARLSGIPSIWQMRDLVPLGWVGKLLFRASTKVVAISQAVEREVLRYGWRKGKVIRIPNGVDLEEFSPRISGLPVREELGIEPQEFVAGMLGQLVPWKGHRIFLEAAAFTRQRSGRGKFLVVGDDLFGDHPGYRQALEGRCRELGLEGNVCFLGYRTNIQNLIAALDVLVLPSSNEPFGRVLIEAMAMAKPVIATDQAGPTEIVEEGITGMLVPPRDPRSLATALLELIEDPDRARQMGKAGRERVEQNFSIEQTAKAVQILYRILCP